MAQGIARPDLNKALEEGGNLDQITMLLLAEVIDLMAKIYVELKLHSDILVRGLDVVEIDPEDSRIAALNTETQT
jgi:hypothetical protein